jgi:hypothetical protein
MLERRSTSGSTWGRVFNLLTRDGEHTRIQHLQNRVLTNNQHKNTYIHDQINECYIQHLHNEITKVQHHILQQMKSMSTEKNSKYIFS